MGGGAMAEGRSSPPPATGHSPLPLPQPLDLDLGSRRPFRRPPCLALLLVILVFEKPLLPHLFRNRITALADGAQQSGKSFERAALAHEDGFSSTVEINMIDEWHTEQLAEQCYLKGAIGING